MEKLGSATAGLAEAIMQSRQFESGMRSSVVLELIVSKKYFSGQVCLIHDSQRFQAQQERDFHLGLSPFLTTLEVFTNPSRIGRLLLAMRQFATFDIEKLWYVSV